MRNVNVRYGGANRASGVCNGVGYIYEKEVGIRDRTMPSYVIVYLLEGSGVFSDAVCGSRFVNAGDVLLIFPGVAHSYDRVDENGLWSECFIDFQGEIFDALLRDGVIKKEQPVLSPGLQPTLVAACDELIRDYQTAVPGQESEFAARTLLLLVRMQEAHRRRRESETERNFVVDACARLQAALDQKLEVAEVARGFGMSERAFRRRFVAHAGISPGRYRLLQRIAAARKLLTESELPISSIAERLGYCDVQFFAKQFREHTGIAPGRFRREPGTVLDQEPHVGAAVTGSRGGVKVSDY